MLSTTNIQIYEKLKARIVSGDFSSTNRLPPVRVLMQELHVSMGTILRILSLLEKDGLIIKDAGSGIRIRTDAEESKTTDVPLSMGREPAYLAIANLLSQAVASGDFFVGNYLPSPKTLQLRYHTSRSNIDAALKWLAGKKILQKVGSHYQVGNGQSSNPGNRTERVYIIGDPYNFLLGSTVYYISSAFFQNLKMELNKAGYSNLTILATREEFPRPGTVSDSHGILGFVYLGFYTDGPADAATVVKDLKQLDQYRRPVAYPLPYVFFQTICSALQKLSRNVVPVCVNFSHIGETVGEYLALAGHRHLAYISPKSTDQPWQAERIKGILSATRRVFGADTSLHLIEPGGDALENQASDKNDSSGFLYRTNQLKEDKAVPPGLFSNDAIPQDLDPAECYELKRCWRTIIWKRGLKKLLYPLFAETLKKKEITAWIGNYPSTTETIYRFLTEKKIACPGRISLIGIDDLPNPDLNNITIWSPQYNIRGYLAAHILLQDIPIKRTREGYVESPGRIMGGDTVTRSNK